MINAPQGQKQSILPFQGGKTKPRLLLRALPWDSGLWPFRPFPKETWKLELHWFKMCIALRHCERSEAIQKWSLFGLLRRPSSQWREVADYSLNKLCKLSMYLYLFWNQYFAQNQCFARFHFQSWPIFTSKVGRILFPKLEPKKKSCRPNNYYLCRGK